MRQTTDYSVLFTPFELAGKRLRNQIAHVSMTTLPRLPDGFGASSSIMPPQLAARR
jgi:hypothetical protein